MLVHSESIMWTLISEALHYLQNYIPQLRDFPVIVNLILFFGPCIFIIEEKNKLTKCTKLILD